MLADGEKERELPVLPQVPPAVSRIRSLCLPTILVVLVLGGAGGALLYAPAYRASAPQTTQTPSPHSTLWAPLSTSTPNFGPFLRQGNVYCFTSRASSTPVLIPNVDPATFEVSSSTAVFSRDATHVYAYCHVLPNADPATFTVLTDANGNPTHYAKDKTHVYYDTGSSIIVVPNADPATFSVLTVGSVDPKGNPYDAHDAFRYYDQGKVVP